jgi:hypothetical protein
MTGQYIYDRIATRTATLPTVDINGVVRNGDLSGKFNRWTGKFYNDPTLDMELTD